MGPYHYYANGATRISRSHELRSQAITVRSYADPGRCASSHRRHGLAYHVHPLVGRAERQQEKHNRCQQPPHTNLAMRSDHEYVDTPVAPPPRHQPLETSREGSPRRTSRVANASCRKGEGKRRKRSTAPVLVPACLWFIILNGSRNANRRLIKCVAIGCLFFRTSQKCRYFAPVSKRQSGGGQTFLQVSSTKQSKLVKWFTNKCFQESDMNCKLMMYTTAILSQRELESCLWNGKPNKNSSARKCTNSFA
jgi:hypothetical protein